MRAVSEILSEITIQQRQVEKYDDCKESIDANAELLIKALAITLHGREPILDDMDNLTKIAVWLYGGQVDAFDIRPNKGLLIVGNVGTGKTKLMQALSIMLRHDLHIPKRFFHIINAQDVVEVAQMGYDFINYHYNNSSKPLSKRNICIDDIGTEPSKIVYFGNEVLPMAALITNRYNLWVSEGVYTHFTSNLMPEDIRSLYGDRVADRISEMCNVIRLTGKSKRV